MLPESGFADITLGPLLSLSPPAGAMRLAHELKSKLNNK
jgi:hypothetical protein